MPFVKASNYPVPVVHTCNPSTEENETGGRWTLTPSGFILSSRQGQPGVPRKPLSRRKEKVSSAGLSVPDPATSTVTSCSSSILKGLSLTMDQAIKLSIDVVSNLRYVFVMYSQVWILEP